MLMISFTDTEQTVAYMNAAENLHGRTTVNTKGGLNIETKLFF